MISIVIPTMWKFQPFPEFINDVARCDIVKEIIIINNNVAATPNYKYHDKIIFDNQPENVYVNPAWNMGVERAQSDKICIANDDVIYDTRILYRASEYLDYPDVGIMGINPGYTEYNLMPLTTGKIIITPTQYLTFGYGGLMFIKKTNWVRIPENIKIWFGDNFQFEVQQIKGRKNYLINDSLFKTVYATTSGTVDNFQQRYDNDQKYYELAMQNFGKTA